MLEIQSFPTSFPLSPSVSNRMYPFPITAVLHTYAADGAALVTLNAKDLVAIPVWKNNRNLDHGHAKKLAEQIGDQVQLLDRGYVVAVLREDDAGGAPVDQPYILDGQHRAHVLRQHFKGHPAPFDPLVVTQPNIAEQSSARDGRSYLTGRTASEASSFTVTATVRRVESEAQLIEYFNAINNIKPIQQWIDQPMILNNYVCALEQTFNTRKRTYIRPGKTCRPYLSSDLVREVLTRHFDALPKTEAGVRSFVERVAAWNESLLRTKEAYASLIPNKKRAEMFEKGAAIGFVLGYDETLPWIRQNATA